MNPSDDPTAGSTREIEEAGLRALRSCLVNGERFSLNRRTRRPRVIRFDLVYLDGSYPATRYVVSFTDDNEPGSRFASVFPIWEDPTIEDPVFAASVFASQLDELIDADFRGLPPAVPGVTVWIDVFSPPSD